MSRMSRAQAVVIGAGFGGLAAAIRLQAGGAQVTLLEANGQAGGRAGWFEADGYAFDTGPTIITAPPLLDALFRLGGTSLAEEVRLTRLEPYYRVRFADGSAIDYGTFGPPLADQLETFETGAATSFQRFMAHAAKLYRRGFDDLGAADFSSWRTFLSVVPDLARLRADRSVYGVAARYFRDPRLRMLFSFHPLFIGGNPLSASSIYALVPYLEQVGGVHYAHGGMHTVVQALVDVFTRLGGRIEYHAKVAEILVRARPDVARRGAAGRVTGVLTADGRTWPADAVVSNADVPSTYRHLVPARWRRHWTDDRLDRLRLSMSLYLLYLGLNRRYPELSHHTIVMPGDYRGVLGDLFERRVAPREPALYIHAPTKTDPTLAPPGGEVLYVLAPVPHLDGRIDWRTEAPRMREQILTYLEQELGLAGIRQAIVVEQQRTPLDFRDGLASERGAAFSIQPLLLQSAYFRPHNRSEDVAGLYLAGAGTHPGPGVPGVLLAGEVAATLASGDLGISGTIPRSRRRDAR
ncbi:MAG: phytoene desaturase family protein, partial [Chloroflexota bacterium]|nr:phytoene desaturase family protein [Chloroflexota bacterium]